MSWLIRRAEPKPKTIIPKISQMAQEINEILEQTKPEISVTPEVLVRQPVEADNKDLPSTRIW